MDFTINKGIGTLSIVFGAAISLIAQAPAVFQGGVVNGASFALDQPDKRVAPGSLISIFGSNLASSVALADSIPISTSLADVESVTFGGVAAPILSVGPGQINVQLPWEEMPPSSGTSNVAVVVTRKTAGASAPIQTPIGLYSPGIFTAPASGAGQALALIFPDNAIAGPLNSISGRLTRPAKPGDIVIIYASGLGPVTTTPADGESAPNSPRTTVLPVVTVGGMTAEVQFSGLNSQFIGLYQINIVIPASAPTGIVPLQIEIGGVTSTKQATIAIAAQ
jgi:uncharacterized protein (TIGR03437 family)